MIKYARIPTESYSYNLNSEVTYTGKLFEDYSGKKGLVKSRSKRRNKKYYEVMFEDGRILTFEEKMIEGEGELL